jgi:small subunit ribosomal protein S1
MVNQKLTAPEIGFTHEDFAALLDKYDYHFSPGDVVPGTVFSIERQHIYLYKKCLSTG